MNNAKNIYSKKNEAEVKRKQAQHRKNLANMRCSIDNKPPVRYRHLQRNMKKEQLMVSYWIFFKAKEIYLFLDGNLT
jgi:hypothetical protein